MYKKPDPKPTTVEATLLWKHPDRLVAMDSRGYIYIWHKPSKQLGFLVEEGDVVFVYADEHTKDVFHMTPKNGTKGTGSAPPEGA